MFNKKSDQPESGENAANKVDQDLIVHNMPNRSRLGSSSAPVTSSQSLSGSSSNVQKSNVKSVGAIIIGLGIILVGALIYLSYRFILKPQAENNSVNQVATQTPISSAPIEGESTNTETATSSSATPIEVIDAITATTSEDVATSSEETTELMPEEGLTQEELWAPILDTDGDGLTDDEEIAMKTNVLEIDTDKDGYLDLAEIKSGYSPLGAGRLTESSALTVYQDPTSGFTILHPNSWTKQSLNNGYTLIISAPDNSLFQVSVQDNPRNQSIADWYAETFESSVDVYSRFKNSVGWEGIMSEDGINFYLTDDKRQSIYAISYIPVISTRQAYLNIYQMMIDNFQVQ